MAKHRLIWKQRGADPNQLVEERGRLSLCTIPQNPPDWRWQLNDCREPKILGFFRTRAEADAKALEILEGGIC